jgi:hypothetical protein
VNGPWDVREWLTSSSSTELHLGRIQLARGRLVAFACMGASSRLRRSGIRAMASVCCPICMFGSWEVVGAGLMRFRGVARAVRLLVAVCFLLLHDWLFLGYRSWRVRSLKDDGKIALHGIHNGSCCLLAYVGANAIAEN